jgi:hypothetical protein
MNTSLIPYYQYSKTTGLKKCQDLAMTSTYTSPRSHLPAFNSSYFSGTRRVPLSLRKLLGDRVLSLSGSSSLPWRATEHDISIPRSPSRIAEGNLRTGFRRLNNLHHRTCGYTPVDSYDDLLKRFNLAKYHSAITLASRSVRNECILLLHKATTLVFNEQVMFNLVLYLESCPQHILQRTTKIRFDTDDDVSQNRDILKVVNCLPDVEAVDYVQNLVAGGWYIYEIMQKMDTVNRAPNGKKAKELTNRDQPDEFLESINTMKAFTSHAEPWFKKAFKLGRTSQSRAQDEECRCGVVLCI